MAAARVLVIVLAGGEGGRLELLTRDRAKPAVPYAGTFRLIDVVLTNALRSGLSDVWVVEQTHPYSLQEHLANGRPWDLDRTTGGLLYLHPRQVPDDDESGWHRGTADALWRNADLIRDHRSDVVIVVSADAVYRLDYDELAEEHRASGAAVTMVTTRVERSDASRYGVVQLEGERVTDYAYKPDDPASDIVTNEVFAFDPSVLDLLDELAEQAGEGGPGDLGDGLLPRLVEDGRARAHPLPGYWRDLGTVPSYWQAHMDLLGAEPAFDPDDADWPLRTRVLRATPGRVRSGAEVTDSLLSPGTDVAGLVRRSVLGPGTRVEAGAEVVDSVLLEDVVVRSGARVERAVVDRGATISASVGGDSGVALIGADADVDTDVPADGRFPEDEGD